MLHSCIGVNHIQKMAWILNKTFTIFEGEDGADQDIVLTPRGSHKPRQYLPAASKRFVCQIVSFNQSLFKSQQCPFQISPFSSKSSNAGVQFLVGTASPSVCMLQKIDFCPFV